MIYHKVDLLSWRFIGGLLTLPSPPITPLPDGVLLGDNSYIVVDFYIKRKCLNVSILHILLTGI